ncbi:MAG: type II toxin-antitoxin system death-on-curing family toxin [Slackia sp.]
MNAPEITRETALAIHSETIARFGGIDGVRDENLLDSALAQPFQTFSGQDLYPGPVEKACRYAFGIIRNHPFIDGNKRTGTALMGTYLRMSSLRFRPAHDEFLSAMLGVADGTVHHDELVEWVRGVVQ